MVEAVMVEAVLKTQKGELPREANDRRHVIVQTKNVNTYIITYIHNYIHNTNIIHNYLHT